MQWFHRRYPEIVEIHVHVCLGLPPLQIDMQRLCSLSPSLKKGHGKVLKKRAPSTHDNRPKGHFEARDDMHKGTCTFVLEIEVDINLPNIKRNPLA